MGLLAMRASQVDILKRKKQNLRVGEIRLAIDAR
jgi:hypothetical protein